MVTLYRLDTGAVFAQGDRVDFGDGSTTVTTGGVFVGQEPNDYGKRNDNADPKQYQRGKLTGNVIVYQPTDNSQACAYLWAEGEVFPA